jgi:hypothetical protein
LTKGVEFMFYFTRSSEHIIFLFFSMLNNKDSNTVGVTSLQRHKYCWDAQLTRTPLREGVLVTTFCDKFVQGFAEGGWFSPVIRVSPTKKPDRHNITDILLKSGIKTP